MDTAVALVETYLRLNGYFTVTEFPILQLDRHGRVKNATDIDILACRFPNPSSLAPHERRDADPVLHIQSGTVDMVIGEVKEGKPRLNDAIRDPDVLNAALIRFGCCDTDHAPEVVKELLRSGRSHTHCGHRVRLIAFGCGQGDPHFKCEVIGLDHIRAFIDDFVNKNWPALQAAQIKDPVLGLLTLLEKAELAKV
jgi:hypothetical protein